MLKRNFKENSFWIFKREKKIIWNSRGLGSRKTVKDLTILYRDNFMTSSKYKKINLENWISKCTKESTGDPPGLKQSPNVSYRSYKNSSNDTFRYDLMSQLLIGL